MNLSEMPSFNPENETNSDARFTQEFGVPVSGNGRYKVENGVAVINILYNWISGNDEVGKTVGDKLADTFREKGIADKGIVKHVGDVLSVSYKNDKQSKKYKKLVTESILDKYRVVNEAFETLHFKLFGPDIEKLPNDPTGYTSSPVFEAKGNKYTRGAENSKR